MVRVDRAMMFVRPTDVLHLLGVLHTIVLAGRSSSSTFLQALRPSVGRGSQLSSVEIAIGPELCLLSIL